MTKIEDIHSIVNEIDMTLEEINNLTQDNNR